MNQPTLTHRLSRLNRLFADRPVYYITACTHERQRWLANDGLHSAFREFSMQASARGVFVGRYVLMPDHLHLFVSFATESSTLSTWMKSLKNALSKTLREQHIPAPHWQKGFFDHVLRSEESYSEKWLYVTDNPVRAGLVLDAGNWLFQGEIHVLETR